MNDKSIDSQSESILEYLKWQTIGLKHLLIINRMSSSVGVDADIVIIIVVFIVITVGLNRPLDQDKPMQL